MAGLRRWSQVDRAIRNDEPLPQASAPMYLTTGLAIIGIITVALAITATVR
jgi:putative membrane protein